jgi:acetyltransferase-like isoleucine patch superfamily enzyme
MKKMVKKIIDKFRVYRRTNVVYKTAQACGKNLKVNGKSTVNSKTILGDNVNFNGMTVVGNGAITIGNNFHSGGGCYIVTENHDYDNGDTIPYSGEHSIEAPIVIKDNVWLGINVIILPGVTIGEGAIVQAGSVVVKDIPAYGVAGGHPAKVFKNRDIEHYEKLKAEKKFF